MMITGLFPYQVDAVKKLSRIKIGALYMEQGTGKTRVTLELVKQRLAAGKIDAVLWLCPCSVKRNLREDIQYHCGHMPDNIIIKGIESLSSSDKLYLKLLKMVNDHNVYLVIDESNLVKNFNAIRTGRITVLSQKCHYKLILNGTPVSRNESDMFAQWYILDWRILGYKSFYGFAANHLEYKTIITEDGREVTDYHNISHVLNVDYLTEKIAPYTYQIKKSECLHLPEKIYRSMPFFIDDKQEEEYGQTKQKFLLNVDEFKPETIYKLFTALQHVTAGRQVISNANERMRTKPLFLDYKDNPRLKSLIKIINKIGDEKCIIFAKYQAEIDDIQKTLIDKNKSNVMFTGKLSQKKRQENRDKFRNNTQYFIANKACGAYGLNLQFCHNIIFYDNDFDLATRMQAEDRVHRIGQDHEVCIYDIYCFDSIDDFILSCLRRKENMVDKFKSEIERWKKGNKMITYKNFLAKDNPDFYLKFGPFFASRSIRKELDGYPLSNESDWVWITALEGGVIVGFAALEPVKELFHIHAVYVFPDYRKKGIMKKLLKKAIVYSGNKNLTATVRKVLANTYTHEGFAITSEKGKNWVNMRR